MKRKKTDPCAANAKTNAAAPADDDDDGNALSENVKELNLNSRLTQLAKFHLIYT